MVCSILFVAADAPSVAAAVVVAGRQQGDVTRLVVDEVVVGGR